MRLLFLNHNLIWRGTFFRCLGFARELAKQGYDIHLWTCAREPQFWGKQTTIDGVKVCITPRWKKPGQHDGGYAIVDNLYRLLRMSQQQFDVVHAFDHRPNVLVPWWMKRQLSRRNPDGLPIFVSDWCDWWTAGGITTSRRRYQCIDRWEQTIEEGSKRISGGVTVISTVLQKRAQSIGVSDERLLLLSAGASPERFPVLDRQTCREKLNLPQDAILFGFVGYSLWDMTLLAEAFAAIKARQPNARLLVIGGGVEAGAINIFRSQFQIDQDVFLPGVVAFDEIPLSLGACDIQLLPLEDTLANQARIPNKLLDYYASARPVIASKVGDTGDWLKQHQTGLAVENIAAHFAEAAEQLIADHALRQHYGLNGRRLIENDLSYQQLSTKLINFYQSIQNLTKGARLLAFLITSITLYCNIFLPFFACIIS